MNQDMLVLTRVRRAPSAVPLLAIGGVCGLAWAAGLRGFMATLDLACTIPHRPVLPAAPEAQPCSVTGSEVQRTFTK
jgi:hypothetical protein